MTASRPIRLSDGRIYRDQPPRSFEAREPLERAVAGAMMAGLPVEPIGRRSFKVGYKPTCENPYEVVRYGSRSEAMRGNRNPIFMQFFGRCRKCDACKKARAQMWQIRAMAEYDKWPITIFGTITMSMDEHYLLDAKILQGTRGPKGAFIRHPANINDMSPTELFNARVGVFGDEMQKYLKRLRTGRKISAGSLRYLLVAEAHDSDRTDPRIRGRPHFHLLFHETKAGILMHGSPRLAVLNGRDGEYGLYKYKSGDTYREGIFANDDSFIRRNWTLGFTKFQFAENSRMAGYLCKYLNKAANARIRASLRYGLLDQT